MSLGIEQRVHSSQNKGKFRQNRGGEMLVPKCDSSEKHAGQSERIEQPQRRIVILSNRLPFKLEIGQDGIPEIKETIGGLVTAMTPLLKDSKTETLWIGWPGTRDKDGVIKEALEAQNDDDASLSTVDLTHRDIKKYYEEFSNGFLWFWFHGMLDKTDFKGQEQYTTYNKVADKFARSVKEESKPTDIIWVQDYHLLGEGYALRQLGLLQKIGFFLHIPWPSVKEYTYQDINDSSKGVKPEIRSDILRRMTHYDLVRFQTRRDKRNFLDCIRHDLPGSEIESNEYGTFLKIADSDGVRRIKIDNKVISIDPDEFGKKAQTDKVLKQAEDIKEKNPGVIMIDIGRRDPTKRFLEGLDGVELAFDSFTELRKSLTYHLIAPESRTGIPIYDKLSVDLPERIERINKKFRPKRKGEVIIYNQEGITGDLLLAHYKASRIAKILPWRDGANLVSQEYVMAGPDDGALILSTQAGSIERLRDVMPKELMVNPRNKEQAAIAIYTAFKLPKDVRRVYMHDLRAKVSGYPIDKWTKDFIDTIENLK